MHSWVGAISLLPICIYWSLPSLADPHCTHILYGCTSPIQIWPSCCFYVPSAALGTQKQQEGQIWIRLWMHIGQWPVTEDAGRTVEPTNLFREHIQDYNLLDTVTSLKISPMVILIVSLVMITWIVSFSEALLDILPQNLIHWCWCTLKDMF